MKVAQRDGILRERDEPDLERHRLARKTARQTLSIPSLIDLAEAFSDFLWQADALRDPLRDLAVSGQDGNVHPGRFRQATLHGLCQLLRRRAGELPCQRANEDADELVPVADVDVVELSAKNDFVAPGLREKVCVGIASDVAQQRLMIDLALHISIEAGDVREPHRQHTRPKREIPRMPGREIRGVSHRHEKVCAPNRRSRHCRFTKAC